MRRAGLRGDKRGTPAPMGRCQQPGMCRESSLEVHREEQVQKGSSNPTRLDQACHGALAAKVLSDC